MSLTNRWSLASMMRWQTIITQLPGLKKRMLLSATDAEEIPQFTGLNRTVKLDFLRSGRTANPPLETDEGAFSFQR